MTTDQLKHLEFIQNVITRMNTNSFQIKGWAVTLVSAFLALFASSKNCCFILAAIFPAMILWFLDAYYLSEERKFRGLYNDVAGISEKPRPIKPFAMRTDSYTGKTFSYFSSFFSRTVGILYFLIVVGLVILFVNQ